MWKWTPSGNSFFSFVFVRLSRVDRRSFPLRTSPHPCSLTGLGQQWNEKEYERERVMRGSSSCKKKWLDDWNLHLVSWKGIYKVAFSVEVEKASSAEVSVEWAPHSAVGRTIHSLLRKGRPNSILPNPRIQSSFHLVQGGGYQSSFMSSCLTSKVRIGLWAQLPQQG